MCIICNMTDIDGVFVADSYLSEHSHAGASMKKAATRMLEVSKIAGTPEQRKRYDRTHKQMVRLLRAWNQIEHDRERELP